MGRTGRAWAGLGTVAVIGAIFMLATALFNGDLAKTVPITVISQRVGLVMNPDAKVKLHGVPIGHVSAIDLLPDGQAALRLAVDPSWLSLIPSNVGVDIASSTVFGAKYVELVPPPDPSTTSKSALVSSRMAPFSVLEVPWSTMPWFTSS